MDVDEVKKFEGKQVLLVLNNGYKFTSVIPKFDGNSFSIIDKYGQEVCISCGFISLIYKKEVEE